MTNVVVQLRRMESSQPWGFRLRGGADQGIPLHVEHIQPKGRAASAGLVVGDYILAICGAPTTNMSHGQVKSEMLRAGNDLDLLISRDGDVSVPSGAAAASSPATTSERRVEIDEQPIQKLGGPTFKHVKPKTYQVLEEQLQDAPADQEPVRPSSIFDRKREDRSDYLKAKNSSIQKAYGESA